MPEPNDPTPPQDPDAPHQFPSNGDDAPLAPDSHDRAMTWAALLARWTEFARSALALPEHGDAGRVRQSIVSIITLQAVTHALGEVDLLDPSQRALGLDRAEILIKQHASEIHSVWRGEVLPDGVQSLIHDARQSLHTARSRGVEWRLAESRLVAQHPGELLMALTMMVADNAHIDLYLPTPGTVMFETSPVAFARLGAFEPPESDSTESDAHHESDSAGLFAIIESFLGVDLEREADVLPRQVYRQFDFAKGGPVRDVVTPMDQGDAESPPAGQPLLIPAMLAGEPQAVPLPPRGVAEAIENLPVVFD